MLDYNYNIQKINLLEPNIESYQLILEKTSYNHDNATN